MSKIRNIYYILPKEDLTSQIMEDVVESWKSLRYSIRPVDRKFIYKNPSSKKSNVICALVKFPVDIEPPTYMDEYRPYSHSEILNAIKSSSWELHSQLKEIKDKYDIDRIIGDIKSGKTIQATGEVYIVITALLRLKFFIHNRAYLNTQEKWELFRSRKFEKANEETMIELSFFYDLITIEERADIHLFREVRNNIVHDNQVNYSEDEIIEAVIKVGSVINNMLSNLEEV